MKIFTEYPCHPGNYTKGRTKPVEYIVIHYVGATGGAQANAKYYFSTGGIKASAHFYVGHASEGGAVYQSVDPKDTAWHCGTTGAYRHPECRNANSIGIEMCCHNDTADKSAGSAGWYFDDLTVGVAARLTKELMREYKIPAANVLRHFDVTGKICPNPFVRDEGKWENFKAGLEEDELSDILQKIAAAAGLSEEEAVAALGVLAKFANTKEDSWEKAGAWFLKDSGLILEERDGREPVEMGELGVILQRFKEQIK